MPMFDFKCPKCGEEVKDLLVRDRAQVNSQPCPKCGSIMERLLSIGSMGFRFNWFE